MIHARHWLLVPMAALALAGCGERDQSVAQGSGKKSDVQAWQGVQSAAYAAPGWKSGDKDSWDAQMRARTQQGQNEYTRAPATPSSTKP
jgi:hypothetical protein